MRISSTLLVKGAKAGLTLQQIGSILCRTDFEDMDAPSILEKIVNKAERMIRTKQLLVADSPAKPKPEIELSPQGSPLDSPESSSPDIREEHKSLSPPAVGFRKGEDFSDDSISVNLFGAGPKRSDARQRFKSDAVEIDEFRVKEAKHEPTASSPTKQTSVSTVETLFDITPKKSVTAYVAPQEEILEIDSEDSDEEEPAQLERRKRCTSMPRATALPSNHEAQRESDSDSEEASLLRPLIKRQSSKLKSEAKCSYLEDPFNEEFFRYIDTYLDQAIARMQSHMAQEIKL